VKYEDAGDNRGRNARRCHVIRTVCKSKSLTGVAIETI